MVLAKLKARSLLFNRRVDCTKYSYDAVGQRTKMREPDGGRFTYWYDGVGQITRLLNPFQENTTLTYDVAGRRTMQKLANRVRASYSYDTANRLTTLANVRADGTYVSRYDYAYDNIVNKIRVQEADSNRVTWSYDRIYQLTREKRSGANAYDTTYTYDEASNRKEMIDSNARTTYVYDAANQLNWLQDNSGRTTFAYDANGNQTLALKPNSNRTTYSWACSSLKAINDSSTTTLTYNYHSNLIRETNAITDTSLTYDNNTLLYRYNNSTSSLGNFSFQPLQLISIKNISYASYDGFGNIRQYTIGDSSLDQSCDYKYFGSPLTLLQEDLSYYYNAVDLLVYMSNSLYYFNNIIYCPHLSLTLNGPDGIKMDPCPLYNEGVAKIEKCYRDKKITADEKGELLWLWTHDKYLCGTEWWKKLPACPCSIPGYITRERIFYKVKYVILRKADSECFLTPGDEFTWMAYRYFERDYHPGSTGCIRQNNPTPVDIEVQNTPGTQFPYRIRICPGQQCCYDDKGKLITHGEGAGTVDIYGPECKPYFWDHVRWDVKYFKLMRKCGLTREYLLVRPPDPNHWCPRNP